MTYNKPLRFLSLVSALLLMAVIFILSAQPGDASNETSMSFASLFFGGDIEFALNVLIRKLAHMAEFAALAVPVWLFVSTFDLKKLLKNGLPFVFTALYAASDEIHQLFVEGRAGQISDIIVDSLGALLGIVFINLLICLSVKYKRKNIKKRMKRI